MSIFKWTYDFECLREALLLGSGFVALDMARRLLGETLVGVGAANGSLRFVEDLLSLLEQRLDLLDEFVLVAFVIFARKHCLDVLRDVIGMQWSAIDAYLTNHLGEGGDPRVGIFDEGRETLGELLVLLLFFGGALVGTAGPRLGGVDVDMLTGLLEFLGIDLGHCEIGCWGKRCLIFYLSVRDVIYSRAITLDIMQAPEGHQYDER